MYTIYNNVAPTQLVSPLQLDTVGNALTRANIANAKARLNSTNGLTDALDLGGTLAMSIGQSLAGQGISKGLSVAQADLSAGNITQDVYNKRANTLNGMNLLNSAIGAIGGGTGLGLYALGTPATGMMGGIAEGGELMEHPNGQYQDIQGPSHEQGGVPFEASPLAKIYSDRVKIDGVSIADRTRKRIARNVSLEQILNRDPYNTVVRKSWERYKNNTEKINTQELKLQELISNLLN